MHTEIYNNFKDPRKDWDLLLFSADLLKSTLHPIDWEKDVCSVLLKNASLCILLKPKLKNSLFFSRPKVGNGPGITFCYPECPAGSLDYDWVVPLIYSWGQGMCFMSTRCLIFSRSRRNTNISVIRAITVSSFSTTLVSRFDNPVQYVLFRFGRSSTWLLIVSFVRCLYPLDACFWYLFLTWRSLVWDQLKMFSFCEMSQGHTHFDALSVEAQGPHASFSGHYLWDHVTITQSLGGPSFRNLNQED